MSICFQIDYMEEGRYRWLMSYLFHYMFQIRLELLETKLLSMEKRRAFRHCSFPVIDIMVPRGLGCLIVWLCSPAEVDFLYPHSIFSSHVQAVQSTKAAPSNALPHSPEHR